MTLSQNARDLCARGDRMFERKETLNSFCQLVAEQFYPERADFTQTHEWGYEFGSHLFDSTPVKARRDLGNAFSSMLRPRGQPWFGASLDDPDLMKRQPVKLFCDHVTATMRASMYARRAQFERATKEGDHDFAAFGNTVISVEVNSTGDGMLYRCHHFRDCAWAEDKDGMIDTLFRRMKMTARQMSQMRGWKLHRNVTKALEKTPDQEFTVMHVMLPFDDYEFEAQTKGTANLKWASVYLDTSNKHLLREACSHEFRYVVPRWQTISGSPYAVSPAVTTSLADARGMQTMARVVMEAGEKQVDPPMKAVMEKIIGDVNLYAGGVTMIDADYDEKTGAVLEPIQLAKETQLGVQMLMRAQQSMAESWYLNKLTLPQHGKTAYETAQLVEEFVRANIPLFEPMEMEYNLPILDETFSIMQRMNAFNFQMMPPELAQMDLTFAFSNPLQDAIEKNKVNVGTTVAGTAAGLEPIFPGVTKRNLDGDAMFRDIAAGAGSPAAWLTDPEKVAAEQRAAAEEQERQNTAQQIMSGLGAAGAAAGVVKQGADATAALQQTGLLGGPGGGGQAAPAGQGSGALQ